MLAGAIPSHMQLWSDEEGPFLIQDWRMMFGCRAAANFASRVSGLITWLLDRVIDEIDLVELAAGDTNPGPSDMAIFVKLQEPCPESETNQLGKPCFEANLQFLAAAHCTSNYKRR